MPQSQTRQGYRKIKLQEGVKFVTIRPQVVAGRGLGTNNSAHDIGQNEIARVGYEWEF